MHQFCDPNAFERLLASEHPAHGPAVVAADAALPFCEAGPRNSQETLVNMSPG
jgi:hypothetical protein